MPARFELNVGLRMLFVAGWSWREFWNVTVQLPPPFRIARAKPDDHPVVVVGVTVVMPWVKFCGKRVERCWFVFAVRLTR